MIHFEFFGAHFFNDRILWTRATKSRESLNLFLGLVVEAKKCWKVHIIHKDLIPRCDFCFFIIFVNCVDILSTLCHHFVIILSTFSQFILRHNVRGQSKVHQDLEYELISKILECGRLDLDVKRHIWNYQHQCQAKNKVNFSNYAAKIQDSPQNIRTGPITNRTWTGLGPDP